jgi:hypothetical protein
MTDNFLPALYLPTTCPPPAGAGQLLLLFDKLFFYRPAENLPTPFKLSVPEALLQGYPPAPFGAELDRFSRLLKDMQAHAAEYYQAYFTTIGQGKEEAAEAGWRQMASQLRQVEPKHEPNQDELWRARLYLALAEIYQASEQEISRGMAAVADRESSLFRELQGDEDDDLEELPLRDLHATVMGPAPGRSSELLIAWGVLYLADASPDRSWLLATADQEGAMLLRERYEIATGRAPEKILSLPLPPVPLGADYEKWREAWRTAAEKPLVRISAFLEEAALTETASAAVSQTETLPGQAEMEQILYQWDAALAALAANPPGEWPQVSSPPPAAQILTFYRLPGISFPQLFRLICRQKEEGPQPAPSSPHAILAVVTAVGS